MALFGNLLIGFMLGDAGSRPATAIWWLLALAGLLAGFGLYTQLRKDGQVQPAPINKQAAGRPVLFPFSPFHSLPYPAKPASKPCQIREQARLYSMSKTTSDMHDSKKDAIGRP
jgi:hypothetical protein